jgi:hypothetical protein
MRITQREKPGLQNLRKAWKLPWASTRLQLKTPVGSHRIVAIILQLFKSMHSYTTKVGGQHCPQTLNPKLHPQTSLSSFSARARV